MAMAIGTEDDERRIHPRSGADQGSNAPQPAWGTPGGNGRGSHATRAEHLAALLRGLRHERRLGRAGDPAYDLNRHVALWTAYRRASRKGPDEPERTPSARSAARAVA